MGRQPRDFLPKNKRERLRSLLKQYGGDLSKFCDKLDDVTVVSDIFGSDSRADKVTTLVAEVPRRESVIDVDEHSNEANDVLTRLQEGTRILSLGCSLCYPSTHTFRLCQCSEKRGNRDVVAHHLEVVNRNCTTSIKAVTSLSLTDGMVISLLQSRPLSKTSTTLSRNSKQSTKMSEYSLRKSSSDKSANS